MVGTFAQNKGSRVAFVSNLQAAARSSVESQSGLHINVPAKPDRGITSETEYWELFDKGCQAITRALETATERSIANVSMTVQTLRCGRSWKELPEDKSWDYMHTKILSSGARVSQLRILRLDDLHLPGNFFSGLAQSMPCLKALTLSEVQLETTVNLAPTTEQQQSTALPVQELKIIRCQFKGCQADAQNNKFNVKSEHFVRFPNLCSFKYVGAKVEARYSDAPIRCPWSWLLSAINPQQVTELSVGYGPVYSFKACSIEQYELVHLKGFSRLTCIKLETKLCDGVMEVLLNMPPLKQAELHLDGAELKRDYSKKVWALQNLMICQRRIDSQWVTAMEGMPIHSLQLVEVASGNYRISLDDQEVPTFLALAKRIKWPASRGELSQACQKSPKSAISMLPYIDYLNMEKLDLDSELTSALAKEAQHRVIAVRCAYYPPEHAESVLPVLLERKRVLVLGPRPPTPEGPVGTWDGDTLWQLLVDFRTNVLKQYHWSDRPEEYCQYERGFRRQDMVRAMVSKYIRWHTGQFPSDPVKCIFYAMTDMLNYEQ